MERKDQHIIPNKRWSTYFVVANLQSALSLMHTEHA